MYSPLSSKAGLFEQIKVLGENPHMYRKKMQTLNKETTTYNEIGNISIVRQWWYLIPRYVEEGDKRKYILRKITKIKNDQ